MQHPGYNSRDNSALTTHDDVTWQVVFHAGEPAELLYIVERGVVASAGRLLAPGGILGLSHFAMGSYGGGGGGGGGDDADCHDWDHTGRTLTYCNLLTLRRTALARCSGSLEALRNHHGLFYHPSHLVHAALTRAFEQMLASQMFCTGCSRQTKTHGIAVSHGSSM